MSRERGWVYMGIPGTAGGCRPGSVQQAGEAVEYLRNHGKSEQIAWKQRLNGMAGLTRWGRTVALGCRKTIGQAKVLPHSLK